MTAADGYQSILTTYQFPAAASTSGDISIPVRQSLLLVVMCQGLTSTGGTSQLVFNADTGSNYVCTFNEDLATGGTTITNVNSVSQAAFIFSNSSAAAYIAVFKILNYPTVSKVITYRFNDDTASSATAPDPQFGGGEWVNTTSYITQVRLQSSANSFNAGTGFMVMSGDPL